MLAMLLKRLAKIFTSLRLTVILLAFANVLWMGIYVLWTNWTTEYLTQSFHLTMAQANGYAWFPPVASTLGGFTGGWISRRAIGLGTPNVQAAE